MLTSADRHILFSMGQSGAGVVVVVVVVVVGPEPDAGGGGGKQASEWRIATRTIIKIVFRFMM